MYSQGNYSIDKDLILNILNKLSVPEQATAQQVSSAFSKLLGGDKITKLTEYKFSHHGCLIGEHVVIILMLNESPFYSQLFIKNKRDKKAAASIFSISPSNADFLVPIIEKGEKETVSFLKARFPKVFEKIEEINSSQKMRLT